MVSETPVLLFDPRMFVTRNEYDRLNRLTHEYAPEAHHSQTTYDELGHVVAVADLLRGTTTTYSFLDEQRQVIETDTFGNSTTSQFDANGNLIWTKDRRLAVVEFEYDKNNRQLKVIQKMDDADPTDDIETAFEYDEVGNVTRAIDPQQYETEYTYDALNRQTHIIEKDGDGVSYITQTDYDANGNVNWIQNPRGYKLDFEYDELNRQTVKRNAWGKRPGHFSMQMEMPSGFAMPNPTTRTLPMMN